MTDEHKKGGKRFYRPYKPLQSQERQRILDHCIVLLGWATRNGSREVSISIISRETNIPRMSLHWILKDYTVRKERSVISKAARSFNYDFVIYKTWNTTNKYKRKKRIIDAVKVNDPFRGKDY
jgi:hypothetical protein